jgi:SAM-dependent methyltransferase
MWQRLVDTLESIYPDRPRYLYQPIEHPYFSGWESSRSVERLVAVLSAVEGAGITHRMGDLLEVGCCTGSFCRAFRRQGWRVFGVDRDEKALSIAEHLDMVFGTGAIYRLARLGAVSWERLLCGGDGWGLIICLSVLHAYHTMGDTHWVASQIRAMLNRTDAMVIDGDQPGRKYKGGVAPSRNEYREWLRKVALPTHWLQEIAETEGRTIYLLRRF